jgi:hypothetical protein
MSVDRDRGGDDPVHHPAHYNKSGVETIVLIDEVCTHYPGAESFAAGNVLRYLARAPHKGNKLEDLRKAAWYLRHLIELVEKTNR